jgi:hypothetical protein
MFQKIRLLLVEFYIDKKVINSTFAHKIKLFFDKIMVMTILRCKGCIMLHKTITGDARFWNEL